ncbi:hypothetical protein QOZ80_1BG0056520 [Eleusine coracana subsp. coracana]|nr:hypothetical protein QOZ80_1BG0056520 [Eleusine coracana subsp. coracana]
MECARKRGAYIQVPQNPHPNRKRPRAEDADSPIRPYDGEKKITVAIDAELLECCVCCGPLKSPLFQCTRGHVSCSECCTAGADMDYECLMCREPETATRCRAMERVLDGLSVPCAFRDHGCTETVPYAEKQTHEATCAYLPCHCPIPGCDGYSGGQSLRHHVVVYHPEVARTRVAPRRLTALRMQLADQARVLRLGDDEGREFMLVVGRDMPSGRALSVVHLVNENEPVVENDFKYKVEVVGKTGVLSLSGQPEAVDRLTKPYQATAFLFVPNAVWEADPQDVPVFLELK